MDNRTRALVKGLQRVSDVELLTTRVEELSFHLLEFPETRGVAVKVGLDTQLSNDSCSLLHCHMVVGFTFLSLCLLGEPVAVLAATAPGQGPFPSGGC